MKTTCMFIISTIIWDMQKDWEFKNWHLDLIAKREWVDWLAILADDLALKASSLMGEDVELMEQFEICKATVDWYLTGK